MFPASYACEVKVSFVTDAKLFKGLQHRRCRLPVPAIKKGQNTENSQLNDHMACSFSDKIFVNWACSHRAGKQHPVLAFQSGL